MKPEFIPSSPFGRMRCLTVGLWFAATAVLAQVSNSPQKADDDWAKVIGLTKAAPAATVPGAKKTPVQIENDRVQKTALSRQTAQAARDFYTAHPTHIYAGEAKKTEALHGLLGITDTDQADEQAALQAARRFREDKANPVSARFQVAILTERVQARSFLGGHAFGNNPKELQKIADKLKLEFGDIPEVNNFYISIARGADMTTAQALATKVLQSASGPIAKTEAQTILARQSLVGQPLRWKLTALEQKEPLDLAQQTGKPTLIYVSSPEEEGNAFAGLVPFKNALSGSVQVIYLTLAATAEQTRALKTAAPVPGVHCYEPRGALGPTAEQFYVRHTPYVFILNRSAALVGFGPLAELANLLPLANR